MLFRSGIGDKALNRQCGFGTYNHDKPTDVAIQVFWAVEESMDVPAEASSLVTAARDGTDERYLHDGRMVSREILFPLITR